MITIESDKSSVEIPSLLSGKIQKLNVKIGDKVSEGSLIAIIASEEEKQKTIKIITPSCICKNGKKMEKTFFLFTKVKTHAVCGSSFVMLSLRLKMYYLRE